MTTPHDYPDYQSYASVQSPPVLYGVPLALPVGNTSTPILAVANWQSFEVQVYPASGPLRVQIKHYLDAAGLVTVGNDTWDVNAAVGLLVRSPLRSNYVNLHINNASGVAQTATVNALFRSLGIQKLSYPVSYQFCGAQAVTIPANSHVDYQPALICAGSGQLMIAPFDASGSIGAFLFTTDRTGALLQKVADFGRPTAAVATPVVVPDAPLVLRVVNFDLAASHVCDVGLTIPPQ